MKNYFKDSLRVLGDYVFVIILDLVFLGAFFRWILPYSSVIFVILAAIIYSDLKRMAIREKKSYSNAYCYPLKGLVVGFIGMSPIIIAVIVLLVIGAGHNSEEFVKHLALNIITAPLFAIYKLLNEMPVGYALALLTVPAFSMLGYLAGFYEFRVNKTRKIQKSDDDAKKVERSDYSANKIERLDF